MGGSISGFGSMPSNGQQIEMGSLSSLGQKNESLIKVATLGTRGLLRPFTKSCTYGHSFKGTQNDALPVGTIQGLGFCWKF